MKITSIGLSLIFLLLIAFLTIMTQAVAADDSIKKMAEIMLNLNHYPSPKEKETLRQITLNSATSKYEKTMANAMINLEHSATAEDKKKLGAIMEDKSAPDEVRTLATIIHDVNHKPTADEKEKLKKLM